MVNDLPPKNDDITAVEKEIENKNWSKISCGPQKLFQSPPKKPRHTCRDIQREFWNDHIGWPQGPQLGAKVWSLAISSFLHSKTTEENCCFSDYFTHTPHDRVQTQPMSCWPLTSGRGISIYRLLTPRESLRSHLGKKLGKLNTGILGLSWTKRCDIWFNRIRNVDVLNK